MKKVFIEIKGKGLVCVDSIVQIGEVWGDPSARRYMIRLLGGFEFEVFEKDFERSRLIIKLTEVCE